MLIIAKEKSERGKREVRLASAWMTNLICALVFGIMKT